MKIFYDSEFEDMIASVVVFVLIGFVTYWAVNKIVPIERPPQIHQSAKGEK